MSLRWHVWECPVEGCEFQISAGFHPGGGFTKPPKCPYHGETEQRLEDAMPKELRRDLEDMVDERLEEQ